MKHATRVSQHNVNKTSETKQKTLSRKKVRLFRARGGLGFTLLRQHWQAITMSLKRIFTTPIATFMTLAVLGLALALPSCLYVLLKNVSVLGQSWDKSTQISLYLASDVNQQQAGALLNQLRLRQDVVKAHYISPQQGLKRFESVTGMPDIIAQLPQNPLPGVIEIQPSAQLTTPAAIHYLLGYLQHLPGVAKVQLDMQWVKRLYGIIAVLKHSLNAFAGLFALGVILIIGNTIRLATQNRRAEIEVIQLLGGSKRFIRRPFLYTGVFYGLFAAIIAWLLLSVVLWYLNTSVMYLASLYGSQFRLHSLGIVGGITLLLSGAVLGFCGSWLAVHRQLRSAAMQDSMSA